MLRRDFSHRTHFPGTDGNRFDLVLRAFDLIERLPAPVFALVLLGLAWAAAVGDVGRALGLWLFFLVDWALLRALPLARRSFGPAKPPALMLAALRAPFALLPGPLHLAAQVAGLLLVVYAFWVEPHRLGLTRQVLRSPRLPGARPLRLLHLGDLHIERVTAREERLLELIREARPDVILFSGDFLNLSNLRDPAAWEACRSILRRLAAPLGVYAVTGSPAVDLDDVVPQLLRDMPIRWLRNEKITLEHGGQGVDVIGLSCTHKPFVDAPRLRELLGPARPERFTILLYHSPDLAPDAADMGVDLQLSGHTHGGQVRLPLYGALYAGSLYGKQFEMGRRALGTLTLYVTRGIGLEGKGAPRVRFLCPPEIVLWELEGQK